MYLVVVQYHVYLVVVLLCTFDIMGDLVYGASPTSSLDLVASFGWFHLSLKTERLEPLITA